jgi:hypothetical protein
MGKNIIPYGSGDSGALIPAGDIEAIRRAFETPKREITISEVYSYYSLVAQPENNVVANTMALIPAITSKLPSLLTKYNTLEAARRKVGGDKKRKELEAQIISMVSFKAGLERLREEQKHRDVDYALIRGIKRLVGKTGNMERELENDESLNLATSLTSEEIAWVSVIRRIPDIVFQHRLSSVPAVVDYFWDGLEWAIDTLEDRDNANKPRDTYDELGITGARDDTVFSCFDPKFTLGVKGLYFAYVEDSYIFERCLEELASGALVSGDGKILQALAARDGVSFSDEYAVKNRHRVNETLSSIVAISALSQKIIVGKDLVRLIGMIERIPDFFFDRRPILFIPSGKGLMFLDPATFAEIEYIPFDGYVAHYAQTEIYQSSYAIDRENAIWDFVFNSIRTKIQKKNKEEGNESTLEALANRIKKEYGIEVALGVSRYKLDRRVHAFIGSVKTAAYTVKMGHWDLHCVEGILSKIPKRLLKGLKRIERRAMGGNPYDQMITGVYHNGSYDRRTQTLELVIPPLPDDTPADVFGISDMSYELTIAHEVGHAVHCADLKLYEEWKKISKAKRSFPINKRHEQFMTAYASTTKEEDFAEAFACYIVFPDEFRRRSELYPAHKEKYEFMKSLFNGKEFKQYMQEPLEEIAGHIRFDFDLREKILMADERSIMKDVEGVKLEELLSRMEREEDRKSHDPVPGPRIFSIDAIDDPEKAEREHDPRGDDEGAKYKHFDLVKVLKQVLRKVLGRRARFIDVEFLELRLHRGDDKIAAQDIANGLGESEDKGRRIVERCRRALARVLEDKLRADETIDGTDGEPEE